MVSSAKALLLPYYNDTIVFSQFDLNKLIISTMSYFLQQLAFEEIWKRCEVCEWTVYSLLNRTLTQTGL